MSISKKHLIRKTDLSIVRLENKLTKKSRKRKIQKNFLQKKTTNFKLTKKQYVITQLINKVNLYPIASNLDISLSKISRRQQRERQKQKIQLNLTRKRCRNR